MPTKKLGAVRTLGGDEFWYKLGSGSWVSLGFVKEGYLFGDVGAITKIGLAGGVKAAVEEGRDVSIELEMAQTDKEALDLKDSLDFKTGSFYMYDGQANVNYEELYCTNGTFFVSIQKKDADKPQTVKITYQVEKQSAVVAVADTGLPTIKKCAVGTHTGVNNYYVWIETAVT